MNKASKPKATELEKWQAAISNDAFQYVQNNYDPVTRSFLREYKNYGPAMQEEAIKNANVAVEQAYADKPAQVVNALENKGVDVSSGRGLSMLSGLTQDKQSAKTAAGAEAGTAADRLHKSNVAGLVATGAGEQGRQLQNAAGLASEAQRKAFEESRADAAARAANMQLIGTVAGMGAGGLKGLMTPSAGLPTNPNPSGQPGLVTTTYQDFVPQAPRPI